MPVEQQRTRMYKSNIAFVLAVIANTLGGVLIPLWIILPIISLILIATSKEERGMTIRRWAVGLSILALVTFTLAVAFFVFFYWTLKNGGNVHDTLERLLDIFNLKD